MKVKCIIIDDEPLAIDVLRSHIEKIPALEIVGTCQNALEAFELICEKKAGLLFLDIQMPGMKGTDFIRNLTDPPKVIITTAYREYALEGYDLNVADYLVKPVSFERFLRAVNKVISVASDHGNNSIQQANPLSDPDYIYIRINKKVQKVLLKDILYADSIRDYITIHTLSKKITVKHTLSSFEELLPQNDFIRIHRSFIVSLKQVSAFTANSVEIAGTELPIGRNYKNQVFEALKFRSFSD